MSEPSATQSLDGLGQSHFDVTVVGTGLSESIAASYLAKQGLSVLHLDEHEYYGDRHASLTVDEMIQWIKEIQSSSSSRYSSASFEFPSADVESELNKVARQYALSVFPAVLPARGDLIDTLIEEDVGKYVNFRLVDGVAIYQPARKGESSRQGAWKRVPAGKDQIFKDSSLSLLDKRRLMKFIMFASSEKGFSSEDGEVDPLLRGNDSRPIVEFLQTSFQLSDVLAETIAYGIAFCDSPSDPVTPALIRMNRYFRSIGRYGPSPFLVAQYGGIGEITQAFCRACAVHGGTYILGPQSKISDLHVASDAQEGVSAHPISFRIPAHHEPVTSDLLIAGNQINIVESSDDAHPGDDLPPPGQANCVAILKELPSSVKTAFGVPSTGQDDHAEDEDLDGESIEETVQDVVLMIFPPNSVEGGSATAVRALVMGPGTGSCPADQFILYVQATMAEQSTDPKSTLVPYVEKLLGDVTAQFVAYYTSGQTHMPLVEPRNAQLPMGEQRNLQAKPEWCEGLDLEARRAQDIIRQGLAMMPERLRDIAAEKVEDST